MAAPVTLSSIGEAIHRLRDERAMSREELSLRTKRKVHRNTILAIEKGRAPEFETLMLIAAGLNMTLSEVLRRAEQILAPSTVQQVQTNKLA